MVVRRVVGGGRPAAGGGRWIDVPPERVERWLAGFDERHRVLTTVYGSSVVRFEAADGTVAECHPPFPPLSAAAGEVRADGLSPDGLLEHTSRDREVGVLLARLGGHAVGVFHGTRLVSSKVGSRPVHGRNKAGGQSQKRFQRRREEQVRVAAHAAAATAVRILVPRQGELDAVVLGGDRRAVEAVRGDRRVARVLTLAVDRFLDVPDPRLAVLESTPQRFLAVRIRLIEP